jgi:flagellar biosynthetic protein FlhB
MADEGDDTERSEDPTPRHLEEAINRGDVVKSQEVSTWFMIAGGALALMVFAGPAAANLQIMLAGLLAHAYQ